ncbi:MAG TPA: hypothetical protein P5079_01085 [Elusimicrobiota bacterium]|nr:hypothetical protein [Elusimicrobiota bacterium]
MKIVLPQELRRKFFHLFTFLYVLVYAAAGKNVSLWIFGTFLLVAAAGEAVRLRSPAANAALMKLFRGIHRAEEQHRPSGILWTALGVFLVVLFVPYPDVVITALCYLAVGDTAAALVGRTWGHLRIGGKSMEGSLACFLACWLTGSLTLASPFGSVELIVGALVATLAEILPLPLGDNLWVPVLSGAALSLLRLTVSPF